MNKRVLLIDDDLDEHDIFSSALRTYNSSTVCVAVNSWSQGSLLLQHYLPDIIFLDFNMPNINGAEALMLIKNIPHLKNTRVYIYSTSPDLKGEKEVVKSGAIKWITKPEKFQDYSNIFDEVFQ